MVHVGRFLLIWALLLAVPYQGYAIAKGCCFHHNNGHHAPATPALALPSQVLQLDAAVGHDLSRPAVDEAIDKAQPSKAKPFQQTKCSACASCCSGSGMPSAAFVAPVISPQQTLLQVETADAPLHLTTGQERPPKQRI